MDQYRGWIRVPYSWWSGILLSNLFHYFRLRVDQLLYFRVIDLGPCVFQRDFRMTMSRQSITISGVSFPLILFLPIHEILAQLTSKLNFTVCWNIFLKNQRDLNCWNSREDPKTLFSKLLPLLRYNIFQGELQTSSHDWHRLQKVIQRYFWPAR